MTYTAPWAAPPRGLATLQLVGDLHLHPPGVVYPNPDRDTVYDLLGRDMRDNLVHDPPDRILQMGDLSGGHPETKQELLDRFATFTRLLGDYDLDLADWDLVIGNHDTPGYPGQPLMLTAQEWATFWGYAAPSYAIDLGPVRVLVVGPTGVEMDPLATGPYPCRPLTRGDVRWIDQRLAADPRPTLLAVHAPLLGMHGDVTGNWQGKTSTMACGVAARDLLEVLNAHKHCIGWVHGHTHNMWDMGAPNTSTFDVGSRRIAAVDASAIFERSEEFGGLLRMPTSFYVTVLDDGKTLDVRWRAHHKTLWDSIDGARFHRLTAT